MGNAELPPWAAGFFDEPLELPTRGRLAFGSVSSTKAKNLDSISTSEEASTSLSKASTAAMKGSTSSAIKDSASSAKATTEMSMSRENSLLVMAKPSTTSATLAPLSSAETWTRITKTDASVDTSRQLHRRRNGSLLTLLTNRIRSRSTIPACTAIPTLPSSTLASTSMMPGDKVIRRFRDGNAELSLNPNWSRYKPLTPSQPRRLSQKATANLEIPSTGDQTADLNLSFSPLPILPLGPSRPNDNQSPSEKPYSLRPRRPVKYVTEMVSDHSESDDSSVLVLDSPKRNIQAPSPPSRHASSRRRIAYAEKEKVQFDFGESDCGPGFDGVGGVDPPQEVVEDDVFENGKAKDDLGSPGPISSGSGLNANAERRKENMKLGVSRRPNGGAGSSKGKRKRVALDDDENKDQPENDYDTHKKRRQIQLDMEDLLIALKRPQEQFAAEMVAKQNELFLRLEERQNEIVKKVDALQASMEDERAARQNAFVALLQTREDALVARFDATLGGRVVRAGEMHRVEVERQKAIEARRLSVEAQRLAVEAQRLEERVGDAERFDTLLKGVEDRRGVEDARRQAVIERQERTRAWEKSVEKALGVLATQVGDVGRDLNGALKVLGVESPVSTAVQLAVDATENVGSAIPNDVEGVGTSTAGPSEQANGSFAARVRKRRRRTNSDAVTMGEPEDPRHSTAASFGAGSSSLGRKSVLERLESMEMDMKECLEKLRAPMGNIVLVKREPQAGSL